MNRAIFLFLVFNVALLTGLLVDRCTTNAPQKNNFSSPLHQDVSSPKRILLADGGVLEFERGKWWVVNPYRWPANPFLVEAVLSEHPNFGEELHLEASDGNIMDFSKNHWLMLSPAQISRVRIEQSGHLESLEKNRHQWLLSTTHNRPVSTEKVENLFRILNQNDIILSIDLLEEDPLQQPLLILNLEGFGIQQTVAFYLSQENAYLLLDEFTRVQVDPSYIVSVLQAVRSLSAVPLMSVQSPSRVLLESSQFNRIFQRSPGEQVTWTAFRTNALPKLLSADQAKILEQWIEETSHLSIAGVIEEHVQESDLKNYHLDSPELSIQIGAEHFHFSFIHDRLAYVLSEEQGTIYLVILPDNWREVAHLLLESNRND